LARKRVLESFYDLQEQVFAVRCNEAVQPVDGQPGSLCWLCFVWFNCTPPLYAQMLLRSDHDENFLLLNNALLNVMERTLELETSECRMSALHGLGLWHRKFSKYVDSIITQFLSRKRSKKLKSGVRQYAKKARHGEVQDYC
jgi:hypothetical protein